MAEGEKILPHYEDIVGTIMSAYAGCHLCQLLIGTKPWEDDFLQAKYRQAYKVVYKDRSLQYQKDDSLDTQFTNLQVKTRAFSSLDLLFGAFTSSPDVQDWTQRMLNRCTTCHTECDIIHNSLTGFLPTRLIDICTEEGNNTLRLVTSCNLSTNNTRYIVLSYCWGGHQSFKLTSSTKGFMSTGFGMSAVPKTIEDAIRIARWFSIPYLWVDALCIIQDDDQDWNKESIKMTDVYRNSYLTITAYGAKGVADGCFAYRSALMHVSCRLFAYSDTGHGVVLEPYFGQLSYAFERSFYHAGFFKRGWTLQERVLSPRILHFGPSLRWECCEHSEWEVAPEIPGYSQDEIRHSFFPTGPLDTSLAVLNEHWNEITETYSRCDVTVASDRFVGLQGVIAHLEHITQHQCLAGLWRPFLVRQLLWQTLLNPPLSKEVYAANRNFAPSWSWLGMSNVYPQRTFTKLTPLVEILHADALFGIEPPSNLLSWRGEIRIKCTLYHFDRLPWRPEASRMAPFRQSSGHKVEFTPDHDAISDDLELLLLPVAEGIVTKEWKGLVVLGSNESQGAYERVGFFEMKMEDDLELPKSESGKLIIKLV